MVPEEPAGLPAFFETEDQAGGKIGKPHPGLDGFNGVFHAVPFPFHAVGIEYGIGGPRILIPGLAHGTGIDDHPLVPEDEGAGVGGEVGDAPVSLVKLEGDGDMTVPDEAVEGFIKGEAGLDPGRIQ